jgi:hypothetical protein
MNIAILNRRSLLRLPCRITGELTLHYNIYFNGLFKGAYCSKCISSYLALLRDFAPALEIIDQREERLYG